jgi:hypothetical protein
MTSAFVSRNTETTHGARYRYRYLRAGSSWEAPAPEPRAANASPRCPDSAWACHSCPKRRGRPLAFDRPSPSSGATGQNAAFEQRTTEGALPPHPAPSRPAGLRSLATISMSSSLASRPSKRNPVRLHARTVTARPTEASCVLCCWHVVPLVVKT